LLLIVWDDNANGGQSGWLTPGRVGRFYRTIPFLIKRSQVHAGSRDLAEGDV
jgi:hypothetical protein